MSNGQDCYMNFVCFSITCSNVRLNSATKRKGKEKESNCPEERVRRGKGTQNSILPLLDLEKKYKVSLTQHSLPFLCSVFLSLVWTLTSSEAPSALSCPPAALYSGLPLKAVSQSPKFSPFPTIEITFQFLWLGSLRAVLKESVVD